MLQYRCLCVFTALDIPVIFEGKFTNLVIMLNLIQSIVIVYIDQRAGIS
jgi:hypothetical protein